MSRTPAPVLTQAERDRRRLAIAFNLSLGFVGLLVAVFALQRWLPVSSLAVAPRELAGLAGLLTAPLLHGSVAHLAANATALLILGTLAGSVYPRATLRALPLLWLGSGLGAWLLGEEGTRHLGASGVTHGLMFMVTTLGLLRRDRPSIAAGMIVMLFYGGSVLAVLPHGDGISWQSHLGGALAGVRPRCGNGSTLACPGRSSSSGASRFHSTGTSSGEDGSSASRSRAAPDSSSTSQL